MSCATNSAKLLPHSQTFTQLRLRQRLAKVPHLSAPSEIAALEQSTPALDFVFINYAFCLPALIRSGVIYSQIYNVLKRKIIERLVFRSSLAPPMNLIDNQERVLSLSWGVTAVRGIDVAAECLPDATKSTSQFSLRPNQQKHVRRFFPRSLFSPPPGQQQKKSRQILINSFCVFIFSPVFSW